MKRDRLLLEKLRNGEHLGFMDRLTLVLVLSYPTVVAMLTSVMTEYIDAAMVGRLGAKKAASIGLMSSTMWLVEGIVSAFAAGFQIQVAHFVGAGKEKEARALIRHGLILSFFFALLLTSVGLLVYRRLPFWLGGSGDIALDASRYAVIRCCHCGNDTGGSEYRRREKETCRTTGIHGDCGRYGDNDDNRFAHVYIRSCDIVSDHP